MKYVATVLVSCLFSAVFLGSNEDEMREAAKIFDTSLVDAFKAIAVGLVFGLFLRMQDVRSYIYSKPMGSTIYGNNFLLIGILAILVGVFGSFIIYYQHGDFHLSRVPLHSSVVGLGVVAIYSVVHWKRRDAI